MPKTITDEKATERLQDKSQNARLSEIRGFHHTDIA